ncbi:MAG: type I glyceraldehyde-3-phosphate dehydrogenase [bacterium]|nr:type I glyceraldehyde-3-phosphate dehydrogenase [bacterium]
MAVKIGINGFGRIGRLVFRAAIEDQGIDVVGVNDLGSTKDLAHLLKYDSTHGPLSNEVKFDDKNIIVDGKKIPVFAEKDPANLPWGKLGAEIVIESTGLFTKREAAMKHVAGGAKRVIISAPSGDADAMFVIGVNDKTYDPAKHVVVSNASCTTNCLAPMVKVLNDNFGVVRGLMTTIHSYTNDQRTLDQLHKDPRRMRAAALSMIPTKTGAASAIGKVIPELNGKLDGYAMRVPTPNVSATDLTVVLAKETTKEAINAALKKAAEGELKGILGYTDDELVSVDFNHCPLSSIIDGPSTKVLDGNFVKVLSWYDNEWGYSKRCVELCKIMAGK